MKVKHSELSNNTEQRLYAREDLVYNVTEDLLVIMEDRNISKKDLAYMLGKSRSYVTQILSGSRNMTLGSLSDICFALGFKPEIKLPVQPQPMLSESKNQLMENSWITEAHTTGHITGKAKQTINLSTNVIDKRDPVHWLKVA